MMIFDWSVTIIVLYGYILIGFSSYIVVAYLDNFDTCLSNNFEIFILTIDISSNISSNSLFSFIIYFPDFFENFSIFENNIISFKLAQILSTISFFMFVSA